MRRLFVTLAASVALTFGMALPVRAIGLTLVTVTCSDGDSVTATVNADELAGLTDAINALTLYPAGLSCTLGTAPVLTSIGGRAPASEAHGVVGGGGRFPPLFAPGASRRRQPCLGDFCLSPPGPSARPAAKGGA